MPHRLEILHALTFPTPKLSSSSGMSLVVCDDHTVQFARDADAHFYLAAHQDVPALLARVAELEAQAAALGQGELETARRELDKVTKERDAAYERIDDLVGQVEQEVALRTKAELRARAHLRYRDIAQELGKRVLALESSAPGSKKSG